MVFLLYNVLMGRPRGSGKNTAMVNGRITAEQMAWLLARADELGGNLSAALRQTITDAQFLEMARGDYKLLREEHPEFRIPRHDDGDGIQEGTSRFLEVVLGWSGLSDADDLALREEEANGAG
jgi:hypothetical protein